MQKSAAQIVLLLLLFLGISSQASSQDINPLLEKLDTEQKVKVLEYMRDLGADLDQQILAAFGLLDAKGKEQASKYLQAIQPNKTGKPARTTVRWSRDTIHFGQIEEGTTIIDSVEVTNTGSTPYSITQYQTACDCAVLKAPSKPLLPGEKAMVRVEFNSVSKKGKVKTGIVLQDNSTPNARSIIYIRGEVVPIKKAKKKPWED